MCTHEYLPDFLLNPTKTAKLNHPFTFNLVAEAYTAEKRDIWAHGYSGYYGG